MNVKRLLPSVLMFAGAVPLMAGCRGNISKKPPFHLIGDMDWQPKYHAEGESTFYKDGRAQRPLVEGTIARGTLHDDDPAYTGREPGSEQFVRRIPMPLKVGGRVIAEKVDEKLLLHGQERFNIYCSPCHDRTGSGHGMVVQHGFFPPIDFHSDRVRNMPDGEIFNVISHGVRNMPSYGYQVPVEDRWAIISWIRVLERSQHSALTDVPDAQRSSILPATPEGATK